MKNPLIVRMRTTADALTRQPTVDTRAVAIDALDAVKAFVAGGGKLTEIQTRAVGYAEFQVDRWRHAPTKRTVDRKRRQARKEAKRQFDTMLADLMVGKGLPDERR